VISQSLCASFMEDQLQGLHQPGDDYRIALYTQSANLGVNTELYTTIEEIAGAGYVAGGRSLTGRTLIRDGLVSIVDWEDPIWDPSSLTARGALIYNASRSNRAVAVMNFGQDVISTNAPFKVVFPEPTALTGLVRFRPV
jgi:hypothetical protein